MVTVRGVGHVLDADGHAIHEWRLREAEAGVDTEHARRIGNICRTQPRQQYKDQTEEA